MVIKNAITGTNIAATDVADDVDEGMARGVVGTVVDLIDVDIDYEQ